MVELSVHCLFFISAEMVNKILYYTIHYLAMMYASIKVLGAQSGELSQSFVVLGGRVHLVVCSPTSQRQNSI